MSVSIKINLDGVKEKLSAKNMERGKLAAMDQMLVDMDKFVPRDQGVLAQTGTMGVDKNSLHWVTPYAKAQFYGTNGKAVFTNYTTPGTGKRWDLKAKGLFMSDWVEVFTKGAGL